jgi:hypothetical protein
MDKNLVKIIEKRKVLFFNIFSFCPLRNPSRPLRLKKTYPFAVKRINLVRHTKINHSKIINKIN